MIKKIYVLMLAGIVALTMCSCGKEEKETVTNEKPSKSEEVEVDKNQDTEIEAPEKGQHTTNYSENEVTEDVTIVVDGREITPTDNNGKPVEAIIHDGVVYLPVKTVADATGRAYYWDGPEYTAYFGDMDGTLENPTVELENMTSINETPVKAPTDALTDNYENRYSRAIWNNNTTKYRYEYLTNMQFSSFKGILYIPNGETSNRSGYLTVIADGKTIYTSPEMTRASAPVSINVNVSGYNDIRVEFSNYEYGNGSLAMCLGEAGFYQ